MTSPPTILIAIGNSDDKLTQREWADFYATVDLLIRDTVEDDVADEGGVVHGRWASLPTAPYQNAAWSFTPPTRDWDGPDGIEAYLRGELATLARAYRQDTIVYTTGVTVFIEGDRD